MGFGYRACYISENKLEKICLKSSRFSESVSLYSFAENVHAFKTKLALLSCLCGLLSLTAKELSAAGERIRHSLDLTEVLQDLS